MKINDVFIISIDVNSEWDDNDQLKGWGLCKFHAYGKSEKGTEVNLTIEATPEERGVLMALMERVTKRVNFEGE